MGLPRVKDNPWVVSGTKPGRGLWNLQPAGERVRKQAGLDAVGILATRNCSSVRTPDDGGSLTYGGAWMSRCNPRATQSALCRSRLPPHIAHCSEYHQDAHRRPIPRLLPSPGLGNTSASFSRRVAIS